MTKASDRTSAAVRISRGMARRLGGAWLLLAACHSASRPGPVPVQGARGAVSALAGTWTGEYWSEVTGRRGRVEFRLRSGADTAYGEVAMTFSPALHVYDDEVGDPGLHREPCTTIDIAFVQIERGKIRGTLRPYWDPDCDCQAHTVFDGVLVDDHIAGTFSTQRSADPVPVTGSWFADRGAPARRQAR